MSDLDDASWLAKERDLCTRAKNGDTRAFEALYDHFAPRLLEIVVRKTKNRAEAKDVLAVTFQSAWQTLHRFRSERSIFFWLDAIADNKVNDAHRRAGSRNKLGVRWGYLAGISEGPDLDAVLDRPRLNKKLDLGMATLPDNQRRAIQLDIIEEQPRERCAEALGISVPAFDMLKRRALLALRKFWETQTP